MSRAAYVEQLADDIDAAVFTGDYLQYHKNRECLKAYCESWLREIDRCAETDEADL